MLTRRCTGGFGAAEADRKTAVGAAILFPSVKFLRGSSCRQKSNFQTQLNTYGYKTHVKSKFHGSNVTTDVQHTQFEVQLRCI